MLQQPGSAASSSAAELERLRLRAWRNAIFVIFALCGIGLASWVARVPTVRDQLGADTAQMGWLIFGLSAGSILGLLSASHLLVWLEAKNTIAISLTVGAIGLIIAAVGTVMGPSFGVIFAGLALFGIGTSVCDVSMNVSGASNERRIGRSIMPLFHAAFSGGTVLGAGLGALAAAAQLPVVVHIAIIAIGMLVITPIAIRYIPHDSSHHAPSPGADATSTTETTPTTPNATNATEAADAADAASASSPSPSTPASRRAEAGGWRTRMAVWRNPRVLLIGLIVLGMSFAEGSANDWLALASVDGHGVTNATGALILGLFVSAMTVGRIVGVRVLDRFGRVIVLRASAVLAVIGLLMFIFIPLTPVAIIGVVFWGLGSSLGFPVGMSAAADNPKTAAANVSVVATIGYCAFLIGPPLLGAIGQHFGLLHALLLVLVLVGIAGIASSAARNPDDKRHQHSDRNDSLDGRAPEPRSGILGE